LIALFVSEIIQIVALKWQYLRELENYLENSVIIWAFAGLMN